MFLSYVPTDLEADIASIVTELATLFGTTNEVVSIIGAVIGVAITIFVYFGIQKVSRNSKKRYARR
jgi:hypothetical protein